MNDSASTPADFQQRLNALAEEMAHGLSRQVAIDRLVELGLTEDEADDQEAAIREQLRAIHRGARAIFRDVEKGLERQQALVRFQELGLSREDAVDVLDSYREQQQDVRTETRRIFRTLHKDLNRSQAVAGFRELGLSESIAAQFVDLRLAITAHWYGEHLFLGVLAATIGAGLLLLLGCVGSPHAVAYLVPVGMLLYGLFFAVSGWRNRRRFSAPLVEDTSQATPFALIQQGLGRRCAIARVVAEGVPKQDAAILINTPLDGVVNCYRSFVVLGLLAVVWGVFLARGLLLGHGDLVQHCGGAALVMWGAAGVFRGVLRWRRFARR